MIDHSSASLQDYCNGPAGENQEENPCSAKKIQPRFRGSIVYWILTIINKKRLSFFCGVCYNRMSDYMRICTLLHFRRTIQALRLM